MANRFTFEHVNETFQDIMENELKFGGKTIVFIGDFWKVLPVIKQRIMGDQIAESFSKSTFQHHVKTLLLEHNIRSAQDIEFTQKSIAYR